MNKMTKNEMFEIDEKSQLRPISPRAGSQYNGGMRPPGFEPGRRGWKPLMLPLHHGRVAPREPPLL